jgi:hypothetical protein
MRFELAEGHLDVSVDDSSELLRAGAVGPSCEHCLDTSWRYAIADPGLVARACEGIEGELGSQVDERARHGCHRNPPHDGGIAGTEEAAPVGSHSLNASLCPGDDLGWRRRAFHYLEQIRTRPPAEKCALSAGQDSGEVGGFDARRSMPDAVDAAVLADEVAAP